MFLKINPSFLFYSLSRWNLFNKWNMSNKCHVTKYIRYVLKKILPKGFIVPSDTVKIFHFSPQKWTMHLIKLIWGRCRWSAFFCWHMLLKLIRVHKEDVLINQMEHWKSSEFQEAAFLSISKRCQSNYIKCLFCLEKNSVWVFTGHREVRSQDQRWYF